MKKIIVYRSFFGTTKRYAKLLHEEIESDIDKYNKVDDASLLKYEMVILCTATYVGWISLRGYLKKHWHVLEDREVILVVIGVIPMDDKGSTRAYNRIPENIRQGIKYFKLPNKVRKENLAPVIEYIRSKDT